MISKLSIGKVDALSRLKDPFVECDCYRAGQNVSDLPCGGCYYCRWAHRQQARFNDDVDDIVPLTVRGIEVEVPDTDSSGVQMTSNWIEALSFWELTEAQTQDANIDIVMNWLEHSYEPTTQEMQLTGRNTIILANKGPTEVATMCFVLFLVKF